MKSKTLALILGGILLVCAGLSVLLLRPWETPTQAEIWSDGHLVETVSLAVDRVITVESRFGTNIVTVKDGKIAVTEADCPNHDCMARGFCGGGAPIVCLPNRMEIRFRGGQSVDGAVG